MKHIQLPLIRHDNQIEFDIDSINKKQFVKSVLNIDHDSFKFKSFGYCLNTSLFYIIIEDYSDFQNFKEERYSFTLNEINEDYFISDVRKLTDDEAITCNFAVVS